jgi:hypothetical protein
MATKKKTEKKAKKFEYTRAQVAERISELVESLSDIDVNETTPNALVDELVRLQGDLEDISYELTEEKYEP